MTPYTIQLSDGTIDLIDVGGEDPRTWFIKLVMTGYFIAAYISEALVILQTRGLSEEENYIVNAV
jgi:hypothetical protein